MSHVTVVCLPADTPADSLIATAHQRLAAHRHLGLDLTRLFTTATRWRRRRLLWPAPRAAAGGPLRLLRLDAQRAAAGVEHWHRWSFWNQIVAGTKPAQPYWVFLERHTDAPKRYPLAKARGHYLAQPRIAAMRSYNAVPDRPVELATADLEAYQSGPYTFARYGWLAATVADAMITVDGDRLTARDGRFSERLSYLTEANARLADLAPRDVLVAILTR
ncbi:hypothetical protein AB0M20_38520 [Actinoplanes sp. NPDC051633]|uniref:hypothetical protein n=1 Tax=Actinoplanes sp. NPDC051633 TaxID=3155670 RepID=UPI00342976B8